MGNGTLRKSLFFLVAIFLHSERRDGDVVRHKQTYVACKSSIEVRSLREHAMQVTSFTFVASSRRRRPREEVRECVRRVSRAVSMYTSGTDDKMEASKGKWGNPLRRSVQSHRLIAGVARRVGKRRGGAVTRLANKSGSGEERGRGEKRSSSATARS